MCIKTVEESSVRSPDGSSESFMKQPVGKYINALTSVIFVHTTVCFFNFTSELTEEEIEQALARVNDAFEK